MSRIARLDREFGVGSFPFLSFLLLHFFFLPTRRSSNVVARCFLRKGGDRAIERIERSWDTYPCSGRYQRVIVHLCGWFYSFLIGQVGIQRDDRIYLDLKSETNFNITNFLFILLSKLKIYIYIYLFSFRLSSLEPFYGNGALFPINTRNHCRMNTTWNKLIAAFFFIHPFSSITRTRNS